ncbi:MAG: hypothetical protein EHM34_06100 [Nitrosopumilales archaeon]|nr:MAG: hypothetical protein EHM34_06100 [Nitrosopumilales archaeon]
MLNQILCLAVMSVLIVGVIPFAMSVTAASNSLKIFPPGGNPYGLSYSEHIQNFWKWILAIPAKDNPFNDKTGEKCATGQSNTSSIFYLSPNGGGKSERTCEVPVGKALFIPVMQVEISDLEYPGASVKELSDSAKKDQDSVNSLYLKIDDKEYKYDNLTKYRIHTEPFKTTWPDNAIFGVVKGGNSTVVADGFHIITEPLAKGNHTIHFKSSLICSDPDCADPNFVQDLNYNIIAK